MGVGEKANNMNLYMSGLFYYYYYLRNKNGFM